MALTFLPVRTPSTVGILVLTLDKYLQSEIEIALNEYQYIFFANNANEASSILAEDQIGVAIIDISTLESDDKDLISEILSFHPELVLVSFLEAGSTHNLVTLSEKYNVYRYLKIPCARKQIANCVNGAVKKHLKQYGNKDVVKTDGSFLQFFHRKKRIAIIAVAIATVLLMLLLTMINPDTEDNEQKQVLTQSQQADINNTEKMVHKNSDVTLPTETISVIDHILLNAHEAYKAEHYFDPEHDSALHFYIKALNLEAKNQEALTGLKRVLNLMVDNINASLKDEKYHHAVKLSNTLVKTLPNSSLTGPLLKHLSNKGLMLVDQAKQLADNGELDAANAMLANAAILLGQNHVEISATESYISSTPEQTGQLNEFLEKAQLRLNNDNLTKPTGDSAKFYLLSLKKMTPGNDKIASLLIELADKLLDHANMAMNVNNIPKAKYYLQEAKTLDVRAGTISRLEDEIIAQEDTTPAPVSVSATAQQFPDPESDTIQKSIEKQEKINKLLILARKSYNSELYFLPENNNASHFLLLAKKIDPHNENSNYSLNELADKTLSMIQIKMADEQKAEAITLINHVKQLGVRTEEIGKLEQEVN